MSDEKKPARKLADVGGTKGGGGEFLFGLVLLGVGAWLFLSRINVHAWGGARGASSVPTAWALAPLFLGVGLLFYSAKNKLGWLLVAGGFAWMLIGILSRASFVFKQTSLGLTLGVLVCFAGGLGLIFRSVRGH